jgi:peroxiredoxin Q/BCP
MATKNKKRATSKSKGSKTKAAKKARSRGKKKGRSPARKQVSKAKGSVKSPAKKTKARTAAPAPVASDESGGLREGDAVPAFELSDQDGSTVSSNSLSGEPYVLYFYPKDDTPGCTKEACGFRDELGKFSEKGVRVIGVSPDKPESHAKFRSKYGLNFTLLSDVDKVLTKACGVWVKKQNYGREYMGVERSTFLVGGDGKVRKVWRRVRVDGHVGDVLGSA